MSDLRWIRESPAVWDDPKSAIIGGAPAGAFDPRQHAAGELLPGEWWRVEGDGARVLGYGWMDCTWGDAEVLLAVAAPARGHGVGTFILDRLEAEAATQGLNYLYNVVRDTHPDRPGLTRWLDARGFQPSGEDGRLLRRRGRLS